MERKINFITLNIRGLGGKKKSRPVFDWLRKSSNGIIFLQETHGSDFLAEQWEKYWQGKVYCAHGDTRSKGVAILFHSLIKHEVLEKFEDANGRFLILRIKIEDEIYTLANCYLPTKDHEQDQCSTLTSVIDILHKFTDDKLIVGGDFNIALNPMLEKSGGRVDANESKRFRAAMKGMMISLNLEDIIRNAMPEENIYTWHNSRKGLSTRLDYWFLSDNILNRVMKCNIRSALYTDHDIVSFCLRPLLPTETRGPGFWKLNVSHLSNVKYVALIKETIKEGKEEVKNYIDKGLAWDYIKMCIRTASIAFAKKHSIEQKKHERLLIDELNALHKSYMRNNITDNLEKITKLKKKLETIQNDRTAGAIIRSKLKNIELGERNTAYFLSLEKSNSEKKCISQLQAADKSIVHSSDAISKELLSFYSNLYTDSAEDTDIINEQMFLNDVQPTLENVEQQNCEGSITENECLKALKKMKNSKTPGIDGLPAEFYKVFWIDIKKIVTESVNFSFEKNELSLDQRRGLISLVPKKDKDRLSLKNWRPIALLTTDYKIIAKCLALRIIKVIDKLISQDQTGYIKGRYIGENIRTVQDAIEYLIINKKAGILLLIDFEKAFDTVRWSFIDKTLQAFNFGISFRKWVSVLYNNIQSAVLNNGFLTQFFNPGRGVRQGCPLSVYLFILVAELLAINVRKNNDIKGISLSTGEIKISQLADDTSLFISGPESITPIFDSLKYFGLNSGLKANVEKTKFYNIGAIDFPQEATKHIVFSKDDIQLLGITITTDIKKSTEKNFLPKLKAIENVLKHWSRRKLSLKGKITVINSLVISLIVYPATVLETPNSILEDINKLLFNFLWDGKRPKIASKVIENNVEYGGLKMPNIFLKVKAWQMSWLLRAVKKPNSGWLLIINDILSKIKLQDLIYCDIGANEPVLLRLPVFYQTILLSWQELKQNKYITVHKIYNQTLWLNNNITIDGKSFFWQNWFKKGIFFIKDIMTEDGNFLSEAQIKQRFDINTNFLQVLQIRQAIPLHWREKIKTEQFAPFALKPVIFVKQNNCEVALNKVKSFALYKNLLEIHCKNNRPKCIEKWNEIYNINEAEWKKFFKNTFLICRSTKLQTFQYRIVHRIITCNHWLFNAKIKDNPECETCKVDDNLQHFFVECTRVKQFWIDFKNWWCLMTGSNQVWRLTGKDILLGTITNNSLDFAILLAKKMIHDMKLSTDNFALSFQAYLVLLKQHLGYEREICQKHDDYTSFVSRWLWLYEQLL